jgi:hypothetical protein
MLKLRGQGRCIHGRPLGRLGCSEVDGQRDVFLALRGVIFVLYLCHAESLFLPGLTLFQKGNRTENAKYL